MESFPIFFDLRRRIKKKKINPVHKLNQPTNNVVHFPVQKLIDTHTYKNIHKLWIDYKTGIIQRIKYTNEQPNMTYIHNRFASNILKCIISIAFVTVAFYRTLTLMYTYIYFPPRLTRLIDPHSSVYIPRTIIFFYSLFHLFCSFFLSLYVHKTLHTSTT